MKVSALFMLITLFWVCVIVVVANGIVIDDETSQTSIVNNADETINSSSSQVYQKYISSSNQTQRNLDGHMHLIDLCSLPPNVLLTGNEFLTEGMVMEIPPTLDVGYLYSEGRYQDDHDHDHDDEVHPNDDDSAYVESCWCVGTCLNEVRGMKKIAKRTKVDKHCDFLGSMRLVFLKSTSRVRLRILHVFSDVKVKAFMGRELVDEMISYRGQVRPVFLTVKAPYITSVKISANGPWCLHEKILFEAVHPHEPPTFTPTLLPTVYEPKTKKVHVRVKPLGCKMNFWPNPKKYDKAFPIAILGTKVFSAEYVDFTTIQLAGPSGVNPIYPKLYRMDDVTRPLWKAENVCDCREAVPDGKPDMVLRFTQGDIASIPEVANAVDGDYVLLTLTGMTKEYTITKKDEYTNDDVDAAQVAYDYDGSSVYEITVAPHYIYGEGCVLIQKKVSTDTTTIYTDDGW
mmetsp:Transcript_12213/g.17357  ORF Transcript_12213/g.17357 Transcript_12213/m.17357 type:complete len:458 (+) Transcript_12213:203-1576(+)|eukprot:CAMPEP_0184873188 /NCGR_PEP_ID=MMETSP0580-20130426/41702_1 /TAXON_ID=1118495 /ORGANISM="Dactyliosolen fragilissimus" /LENGTH=457 /DNA_ID=CAMNT_0027376063 /DNA_START=736 /DNA_END=2106 /DNA_ORIENTATION=-